MSAPLHALALVCVGCVVAIAMTTSTRQTPEATPGTVDMRAYWPNEAMAGTHYLDGINQRQWSVLWFDVAGDTFRQYNSNPASSGARCHYDELAWASEQLGYRATIDTCGEEPNGITYDPPIVIMPRSYSGPWTYAGEARVTFTVGGVVRCTGTVRYVATVGAQEPAGIPVRTRQTTTWVTGDVDGGCWAGTVTEWQEDYRLAAIPADAGQVAPALAQSAGGNLAPGVPGWDIAFARWQPLPPPASEG